MAIKAKLVLLFAVLMLVLTACEFNVNSHFTVSVGHPDGTMYEIKQHASAEFRYLYLVECESDYECFKVKVKQGFFKDANANVDARGEQLLKLAFLDPGPLPDGTFPAEWVLSVTDDDGHIRCLHVTDRSGQGFGPFFAFAGCEDDPGDSTITGLTYPS